MHSLSQSMRQSFQRLSNQTQTPQRKCYHVLMSQFKTSLGWFVCVHTCFTFSFTRGCHLGQLFLSEHFKLNLIPVSLVRVTMKDHWVWDSGSHPEMELVGWRGRCSFVPQGAFCNVWKPSEVGWGMPLALVSRARDAVNTAALSMYLQQRVFGFKMLVVPRLRHPDLEVVHS